MTAITAQMVKTLRDKTGAGMMDCKKALTEAGGDEEKAIIYLREKGLAKAAKKAGRSADEGTIGLYMADDASFGVLVELKCETDFAAKNEEFTAFAADLAAKVAAAGYTKAADVPAELLDLTDLVTKIGENMMVGRIVRLDATDGFVGAYIHMNGKIGVLVAVTGERDDTLGKELAMQVAAACPMCIRAEELSQDVVDREKSIFLKQAMDEGKPEAIAEKIVLGRMAKFHKEVCLLDQPFIKDDKQSIKQLLCGRDVTAFVRLALGEDAEED